MNLQSFIICFIALLCFTSGLLAQSPELAVEQPETTDLFQGKPIAWGNNASAQTSLSTGLKDLADVAVGSAHSMALRGNGTVSAWGNDSHGQTTVPAGLANVTAIAAGEFYTVALKSDGTVIAWGSNS